MMTLQCLLPLSSHPLYTSMFTIPDAKTIEISFGAQPGKHYIIIDKKKGRHVQTRTKIENLTFDSLYSGVNQIFSLGFCWKLVW